jgi:hypothetical protein
MAYMRKRSAEAMGGFWSWITGESPAPDDEDAADPNAPVYCWNGQTVPAAQCPPMPDKTAAAPVPYSPGLSNTQLAVIGVGVVAAYVLITKKKRR